ncbi:MAG TPA: type II toxin-antitoxin system VapC family toxin [Candidatus Baltobacteraceae bacterium]|nr:type II toxin-antitoxin system VapC family toxin [Candidatus Baltobacteraceae bacterium]
MNPILLDTHAALWAFDGSLKRSVATMVDEASRRGELLLSPITAWEIGLLARKRRFTLAATLADYVRMLFAQPGVLTAPITPAIAASSTALPGEFHADPADRILVATAAAFGASLVTRDKAIHNYAKATKHIRCIAC